LKHESALPGPSGVGARRTRSAILLDFGERAFVLALAASFFSRMSFAIGAGGIDSSNLCNLLITISEGLTALFILVRRPGEVATSLYAWAISIAGTCAPLMVVPGGLALLPAGACIASMSVGLAFTIAGKAVLRRSFGIVPANRGVQRGGPYGIVRHPIYAGYLLTHAGFLAANFSLWNVAVYAVCWLAMILRIAAEEEVLSADPAYRLYAGKVRHRLIPAFW
jgi:protein-S-isoprenylcysteine O-methyltransferase Ste14